MTFFSIIWQNIRFRWWKDSRSRKGTINLSSLKGNEWLRLLAGETILHAYTGWCPSCRSLWPYAGDRCGDCKVPIVKFDSTFWESVGKKILQALRKDRKLLGEAKAERENLYKSRSAPAFPPELGWLTELWNRPAPPAHRPFDQRQHYDLASALAETKDFGLSDDELLDLLSVTEIPNGPFRLNGKPFGGLPGEILRQIRDRFLRRFGASGLVREEWWRSVRWAHRQQMVPMARLHGERPK
jgi:hypothetical protein